jgi:outer membrane protein assembly factor BamB
MNMAWLAKVTTSAYGFCWGSRTVALLLQRLASLVCIAALGWVAGCSSGGNKSQPAELAINTPSNTPKLAARLAWSARLSNVNFPLNIALSDVNRANSAIISVASSDGIVASFDAATGRELWRAKAGKSLAAGVGAESAMAAVVTESNELLSFDNGREVWRQKLNTSSFTAPLVSGGKVFVLGSDRSISAFDGAKGNKLWTQKRSAEALTLRQSGVLLMVSDTVVTSLSGRLLGLNPLDGSVRWDTSVGAARGTNDVERLVDLVGRVSTVGDVVCARAFRVSVGCVNTLNGKLLWSKPAVGFEGVQADASTLYGAEADGKVIAWNSTNGERLWAAEQLISRNLTAPAVMDKAIVVGDSSGSVYFLSKTDGSALNRLPTDGSAFAAAPVVVGNTLVVVTRIGGIFGFVAE